MNVDSVTWAAWFPDGWAEVWDLAKATFLLIRRAVSALRWLLVGSIAVPLALLFVGGGIAAAAARALVVGWAAMLGGLGVVFFLGMLFSKLIPMSYRIDKLGIARMSPKNVGAVYSWPTIVDLRIWRRRERVARIEFRTAKERFSIPVSRTIELPAVVGMLERWYGKPVPCCSCPSGKVHPVVVPEKSVRAKEGNG